MNYDSLDTVEDIEIPSSEESTTIDTSLLSPNPYQPRLRDTDIDDLAQSILQHGQLQPIIINQKNIIVGGHRRFYAHKHLNKTMIKYTRIETTIEELYTLALVENEERENLTDIELAISYTYALEHNIFKDAKELAESLNKSASHICKIKSLLKLPDEIKNDISENKRKVSPETLNLLLKLDDQHWQKKLYEDYIHGKLNRAEIKEKINSILKRPSILDYEPIKIKGHKVKVNFDIKHLGETQKDEFEQELENLLEKYKVAE